MRSLALVLLAAGLALPAAAGAPLQLTGLWEGSISCKTEAAGGKGKQAFPVTLAITQLGPSGPPQINLFAARAPTPEGSFRPR
jgi:hypothetical protein